MSNQKNIIINYLIDEKLNNFTPHELQLNSVNQLKNELRHYYNSDSQISKIINNTESFTSNFFSVLNKINKKTFCYDFFLTNGLVINNIFEYSNIYHEEELRIIHYDNGFKLKFNYSLEENRLLCLFSVDNKSLVPDLNSIIPNINNYFNYLCNIYKEEFFFSKLLGAKIIELNKKLHGTHFDILNTDKIINIDDLLKNLKEALPLTKITNDIDIFNEFQDLSMLIKNYNKKNHLLL